jgi:hypothetical protein
MLEADRRQGSAAVMDEVAQYREYAGDCRGLAAAAKKPEHKKALIRNGCGLGYGRQTATGIRSPDSKRCERRDARSQDAGLSCSR